ncbi:MAG: prepilin-type N-terminal cleavage/methylation domain-containing protein [Pseudomonadota bacterium]
MSIVGRSNKPVKNGGFTFIEMIVVISIISVLLVFSFPVIKNIGFFSEHSSQAGDIIRLVEDLKIRAIEKNLDYQMHIDIGAATIWVTHENMDEQQKEAAMTKAVMFSDRMIISDVWFPFIGKHPELIASITFRKLGYSDFVLIHIVQDDQPMTIKIEPFSIQTEQLKHYVYLEDCI